MYFYGSKYFLILEKVDSAKKKRCGFFRSHGVLKDGGFRPAFHFRRGIYLKIIPYHNSRVDIGLVIRAK
ncbi:hypothetical protein CXU19_12580 [Akkermansia muciniphila]|jgi:hypothetical protein|nr:hypothetical protein CXU19_12580 [Akkermansia muciniphila]PNC37153.1 hypothetical protein CXU20_13310 [Akkermansia muciniphila]